MNSFIYAALKAVHQPGSGRCRRSIMLRLKEFASGAEPWHVLTASRNLERYFCGGSKTTSRYTAARAVAAVFGSLLFLTTAMSAYAAEPSAGDPAELNALAASRKPIPNPLSPLVANPQTAVAAQMCFTCGGDWPIFAGTVHAVTTGNLSYERGSGCSGALTSSTDRFPFLCSK